MNFSPALWGIPVVQSTADRNVLFATPLVNQRVQNLQTGNVERWTGTAWVTANASPSVSITDTGAVGDGTTDCTTLIQGILTTLGNAGGGTALVPVGTFIADGIAIPSNVQLLGMGRGRSIIKSRADTGQSSLAVLSVAAAVSNWAVRDVSVQGFLDIGNDSTWGISVAGTDGLIENVEGINNRRHFITRSTAARIVITKCRGRTTAGTAGYGVYIQGSTDVTVAFSTFTQVTNGVAWSTAAVRPKVIGNHVDSTDFGIGGDPGSGVITGTDGVVQGNTCVNATSNTVGHGLSIDGSLRFTVSGNSLRNNASCGIFVGDNPSDGTVITGNVMTGNTQSGMFVAALVDGVVSNNIAMSNGIAGIVASAASTNSCNRSVYTGNICRSNGAMGLKFDSNVHDCVATGNAVDGNTLFGVVNDGKRNLVANNRGEVAEASALTGVLNNGIVALETRTGIITVHAYPSANQAYTATFHLGGTGHTVQLISDPESKFSATAASATKVNVYWSAGNARYELENKNGSTLDFMIQLAGS